MLNRFFVVLVTAAVFFPGAARAHHGLDFISVQTAHLPVTGTAFAIGRLDFVAEDEDEFEFEPAVLFGAADWLTLELHAHFEKLDGESAQYESLAPAVHFRLTPREQPLSFGVSVEYEIARDSAEDDVLELASIVGYEFSTWTATANLLYEKATNESAEWGYAAGVRNSISQEHAFGLELLGSLENDGASELLLGYYGELSQRITINAGIGTGLDGGPDWSARTAIIWQFK